MIGISSRTSDPLIGPHAIWIRAGLRRGQVSTAQRGQDCCRSSGRRFLLRIVAAAAATAERFIEHLRAASGALGQSLTGLLRRAVRAVELWWNFQVRRGKPDPLGADVVHVREDRRNGTGLAGRFGSPGDWVKMF